MIDFAQETAAFFSPNEFADPATVQLPAGPADVCGIISSYADRERPASNTNSGRGSFLVGAADIRLQPVQMLTPWAAVADAQPECLVTVHQGQFAGAWRARDIQRDGDVARFILHSQ